MSVNLTYHTCVAFAELYQVLHVCQLCFMNIWPGYIHDHLVHICCLQLVICKAMLAALQGPQDQLVVEG